MCVCVCMLPLLLCFVHQKKENYYVATQGVPIKTLNAGDWISEITITPLRHVITFNNIHSLHVAFGILRSSSFGCFFLSFFSSSSSLFGWLFSAFKLCPFGFDNLLSYFCFCTAAAAAAAAES